MSDIKLNYEYKGTREAFLEKLKEIERQALPELQKSGIQAKPTWREDGASVQAMVAGMSLGANLEAQQTRPDGGTVFITIALPLFLGLMKGPIEQRINEEMGKLLAQL